MTSTRRRVMRHLDGLKGGLILAAACALAPSVVACDPAPRPAVQPSAEPSTASAGPDGEISLKLMPPQGEWSLKEVEVKNARILARDGDSPLQLRVARSEAKQGETTVEGADEPIEVSVTYGDKKAGTTATVVYKIATPPKVEEGTPLSVDVAW